MEKTVVELFAGVGGFRVGLNDVKLIDGKTIESGTFHFVWMNQWEPATTAQHAYDCYVKRFGKQDDNSNSDITKVDKNKIPDHSLLVGGFPCQDYSVARTLSGEKGINGKKGVLWWQINDILVAKKPPFVLLENVDRLLKSPSTQRGRDFGIMLRCFADNGYSVDWRVINAADYGHPQRRRRVYIFAYRNDTKYASTRIENDMNIDDIFSSPFPIENAAYSRFLSISKKSFRDLVGMTSLFSFKFGNSGHMSNHEIKTADVLPIVSKAKTLGKIRFTGIVDSKLFLGEKTKKFEYLKGSKKIQRTSKEGHKYSYSEGSMSFPDSLALPGRTMLTSEGTVNRSTHVIIDKVSKNLRILTPLECERLDEFPDKWTETGMPDRRRYFMMGNALVCGIIRKIGKQINTIIENENDNEAA